MGKEKSKELFIVGNKKFFGSVIRKEKGYFSFKDMLKAWKSWFIDQDYVLNEKAIGGKDLPSGEREEKIEWTARRDINEYVRYHITIFLWIRRWKDVKVKIDNKEEVLQKGDIYIGFKGFMEKDYKGKWRKHEFLRQMYDRYLVPNKLDGYEGKLWLETNDLIALTKKHMIMMPLKKE